MPAFLRSLLSRPGAIILVVLLGLLPVRAWTTGTDDDITIDRAADGLRSVTWTGTVAADGQIAVRVHYDLDDTLRTFDVRVPIGARYVAVDGDPIALESGRFASVSIDGPVTVTYELAGRVQRYRDGALVVLAGTYGDEDPVRAAERLDNGDEISLDGDYALFNCPRCYLDPIGYGDVAVFGALYATGAASGELRLANVDPVRRDVPADVADSADQPDAMFFLGSDISGDAVSMLAVLPAGAVPEVERSNGDVASALSAFEARFTADDDRFRIAEFADDEVDRTPAWILTALFVLMLVVLVAGSWIGGWSDRRDRRATERQGGGVEVPRLTGSSRPNDLSPAMVALVVNHAVDPKQSFVAATILDLARRRVIRISGSDNRRFTIEIPAQPAPDTEFERTLLKQMRPLGVEPNPPKVTEIVAPPVWHGRAPHVVRALARAVVREGVRAKVIRRNRLPLLIVPIAIAMGVVTLTRLDGLTVHAWLAITVGSLIGLATAVGSGAPLTAYGREQRQIWTDYGSWLRGDRDLEHADVTDIEILGESLVYGAAVGAAPNVTKALSPMPSGPR